MCQVPAWSQAAAALVPLRDQEAELAGVLDARDADQLRTVVDGWRSGDRVLPEQDREIMMAWHYQQMGQVIRMLPPAKWLAAMAALASTSAT